MRGLDPAGGDVMSAAMLSAEVMARPEGERLSYALDLLAYYLDPADPFVDAVADLGLRLCPQEIRILHALERRRGRVVTREALHAAAMLGRPHSDWSDPTTVYARLGAIRAELRRRRLPVEIRSLRGLGYRLEAPAGFRFGSGGHA
ncbi:winged helix-turn-helix domain-containing protein [Salipiger thiooxidans]|uniref:winged helix-turn-helix domain-containing protein n=1 Tax=Salipiger thiooxidans TaxID=282683 RepID=UPI001CD44CF6|nr:winged helix-turn-helix domain-containing protein [Salipiger thiooxidans]MCA0851220.1 winged helix-turn-helix domain-containing protein [Salipiger thiooxidans]